MVQDYREDFSRIPDDPLLTVEIAEPSAGLKGWVCIHTMGRFGASGGMRCVPDISKEEVQLLAKAMSYKYCFWNIEQGGAKAGLAVSFSAAPDEKRELIQRAAAHLKPLTKSGIWSAWTDMHFYLPDLQAFCIGGDLPYRSANTVSSHRTAVSAIASVRATTQFLGRRPEETRIAVEGFGHVAHYLAKLAAPLGYKIVAVSNRLGCIANDAGLDLKMLLDRSHENSAEWITEPGPWEFLDRARLFSIPCDVLVPGARVHAVDREVASNIEAKAVVPTANVPCTDEALAELDRRGIVFIPDYVVNGGGVCGHILGGDMHPDQVKRFDDSFIPMVVRMLETAQRRGVAARTLAEETAHRNYSAIAKGAYVREGKLSRVVRVLQKKKLFPGNRIHETRVQRTYELLETAFK